jgi:hypothetical protein
MRSAENLETISQNRGISIACPNRNRGENIFDSSWVLLCCGRAVGDRRLALSGDCLQ